MCNNQVPSSYSSIQVYRNTGGCFQFHLTLQNAQIPGVHSLIWQQKCVKIYPEVNDIILQDWRISTGGMNCVLHEPITGSVNFDIFI